LQENSKQIQKLKNVQNKEIVKQFSLLALRLERSLASGREKIEFLFRAFVMIFSFFGIEELKNSCR